MKRSRAFMAQNLLQLYYQRHPQSLIGEIFAPAVGSGFWQSTKSLFAGGKNSSTGNCMRSNKSHGLSSVADTPYTQFYLFMLLHYVILFRTFFNRFRILSLNIGIYRKYGIYILMTDMSVYIIFCTFEY